METGRPSPGIAEEARARLSGVAPSPMVTALSDDVEEQEKAAEKIAKKRGRKTEAEEQLQDAVELKALLVPLLSGLSAIAAQQAPEFGYTREEIDVIAFRGAKVLAKYLPDTASEYQDEIMLALVLGGSLIHKGQAYMSRVQKEKSGIEQTAK